MTPRAVVRQAPLSVGFPRQEHVVEGVAVSFSEGLGVPDPLFDDLVIKSLDPCLLLPFQEPGVMLSKMETIWRFAGANTNKFKPPSAGSEPSVVQFYVEIDLTHSFLLISQSSQHINNLYFSL